MRSFTAALLVLGAVSSPLTQSARASAADEAIVEPSLDQDVLFVGHSLVGLALPHMLADLVAREGGAGEISFQIINGAPLRVNWENSSDAQGVDARAVLPGGEIDALVITEAVPLANHTTWSASDESAYHFYRLAIDSNPDARVFLYETWHSLDSGTGVDVPWDDGDDVPWRERIDIERPRWESIADSVNDRRAPGEPPMHLVPAGRAFGALHDAIGEGRVPGVENIAHFFLDDIHTNAQGAYYLAMVHYATLYGRSPVGLPSALEDVWGGAFEGPSPALAAALQELAWQVVRDDPRAGVRERTGARETPADTGAEPRRAAVEIDRTDDAGDADALALTCLDGRTHPQARPDGERSPGIVVSMAGLNDWATQAPFLDVMKSSRPWIGHLPDRWGGVDYDDLAAAGHLDRQGWPTTVPERVTALETLILTDQPTDAVSLAGRWRLTHRGEGTIEVRGRVTSVAARDGEIHFDYTPGDGPVRIAILDTDPNGVGEHIRDIVVVKEEHAARFDAGELFNPRWLDHIRGARSIRFMTWMTTNDSEMSGWDERPKPDDVTYTRLGAPLEVMVALANEIGADPWFTLPHLVDDDHVRRFATRVRDTLDPGLVAHAEFSNEVWNFQFTQARWAADRARERWGADAPGDAFVQYAGVRAAEVADIWAQAFGAEADDRLVRVIATQSGWIGLEEGLLSAPLYVAENPDAHRPPAESFDAYAITGYFTGRLGEDPKAQAVTGWLAESREAGPGRFDHAVTRAARELLDGSVTGDAGDTLFDLVCETWPYHAGVAERHGLDLVMYEGGTHVVGLGERVDDEELTAFFTHLNYTPEMGRLYEILLSGWAEVAETPFNVFVDVAAPSKWGSWGALRHLDDDNPRWRAIAAHLVPEGVSEAGSSQTGRRAR